MKLFTPHPEQFDGPILEVSETLYSAMFGVNAPLIASAGAALINPASVTVSYKDIYGNEISPKRSLIGSDPALQSYSIAEYIDLTDPGNPSFDESKIATLYRIGQNINLAAPAITTFVTPASLALTLNEETTTHTFIYLTQAQIDEGYTVSPDGTVIAPNGEPFVPGVPNTGLPRIARNATAATLVLVAAIAVGFMGWRRISRSRSRS